MLMPFRSLSSASLDAELLSASLGRWTCICKCPLHAGHGPILPGNTCWSLSLEGEEFRSARVRVMATYSVLYLKETRT